MNFSKMMQAFLHGYYNYCMDEFDGHASEEAIEMYLESVQDNNAEELQRLFRLEQASQQFVGYTHGKEGYSVESLIESMGLTFDEWEWLKENEATGLSEKIIANIDSYFDDEPD